MSTDFQNKIDIEPILDKINSVIRKELNKVLYNNVVKNLSAELRKCQKELEEARKYYQQTSAEVSDDDTEEHILLNIEDISDSDSETSIVNLLNNVKVCATNTQIKSVIIAKIDDAEEDEEAVDDEEDISEAEEDEDEDEEDEEDEEEEDEDEEDEAADEEEDISEAAKAGEELSTQAVNNTIIEEDDIETEESESEEEEEEEEEEDEVFEIEIDDITYYATSEENGPLYEVDEYGEPGKQVGSLKDGEPTFFSESAK